MKKKKSTEKVTTMSFEEFSAQLINRLDRWLDIEERKLNQNGKKQSRKIIITKQKQKVLKVIIERRAKGHTYDQIAKFLEKEKIPTLSNRGSWHPQTIHRLFTDEINKCV